jgi:hypothetical protein
MILRLLLLMKDEVQTKVRQHLFDFLKSPVASLQFFIRGDYWYKMGSADLPNSGAHGVKF